MPHSCGEFRIIRSLGDSGDFQTMLDDPDVVTRSDVPLIGQATIHPQFRIAVPLRFRIKEVGCPGIETEHVRKDLQVVVIADIADRLVFGVRDDSFFAVPANEIRIDFPAKTEAFPAKRYWQPLPALFIG